MLDVALSQTSTYNGWSNQETWLAGLWLANDDGCYALQDAMRAADDVYGQVASLEQSLRDQLDDEAGEASLWSDLLTTAFNRINWVEVIENNR